MTTEDYVSYETAKLLKEKGFDIYVSSFYDVDGEFSRKEADWNWNIGSRYSAPTLQMAIKWLRDVHKIHIIVVPISFEDGIFWGYKIVQLCSNNDCLELHRSSVNVGFDTYEEAAESAIKYCLEKLI